MHGGALTNRPSTGYTPKRKIGMPKISLLTLLLFFVVSCGEVSEAVSETGEKTANATDTTGEIQGDWKNEGSILETYTFEGNLMIVTRKGEGEVSRENFVIGRTCPNVSDAVAPTGDGRYLAIPDDGRCYFISKLNERRMEMSVVGEGEMLRLVRAEGEE